MKKQRRAGIAELAGLHAMRTLHSTGRRSIPRVYQSSAFIDLYMLAKEKERLEKESSIMGRRGKIIESRLREIEIETEKLRTQEAKRQGGGTTGVRKSIPLMIRAPREWKKMALHY